MSRSTPPKIPVITPIGDILGITRQTTVQAVKPYFAKFLDRWPKVTDLAAAPSEDVMAAWAGLGYYARARNLHEAARSCAASS